MSTTALYKFPGSLDIHGGKFDFLAVPDEEVEARLAEGWSLTTPDAKALHQAKLDAEGAAAKAAADEQALADAEALVADNAPATKAELQAHLTSLGISFDGRAGIKALTALLPAA
jgi:hypothetical protein